MKITIQGHKIYLTRNSQSEYPWTSMILTMLLLYMAPFVSQWLALAAFAVCVYRVVRYDARIFAVDYGLLIPIAVLMKLDSGVPLAIYLYLIAAIWYFVRDGLRAQPHMWALLLLLLNYLLARMQLDINDFVLLFGQVFALFVLISKQDSTSAEKAVKGYCVSLLISSAYAYLLRNTSALAGVTGMNSITMFGTNLKRFCGLAGDPNYYMTFVIVGIALVLKLRDRGAIGRGYFWVQIAGLSLLGALSYSKAFLLMYVLTIGIYVIWQFWNKKLVKGMVFTGIGIVAIFVILTMEDSPFAVIINRLTSAQNLRDLTTGRTKIFALYWEAITVGLPSLLFGKGLAAEALYRDPHMVYLEVVYYLGFVGIAVLFLAYFGIFRMANKNCAGEVKQNLISKYIVLGLVLVAYLSLHGIFSQMFHGQMLMAALGLMVTGNKTERTDD